MWLSQISLRYNAATLEIYLNYSPEDDTLFLTDTPCVNGSFNSIIIQSRDCKQYTPVEQVQLREGFAVLLDTDRFDTFCRSFFFGGNSVSLIS